MWLAVLAILAAKPLTIWLIEAPNPIRANSAIVFGVGNVGSRVQRYEVRLAVRVPGEGFVDASGDILQLSWEERAVNRVIYPDNGLEYVWVPRVFRHNYPMSNGIEFRFRVYEITADRKARLEGETKTLHYRE